LSFDWLKAICVPDFFAFYPAGGLLTANPCDNGAGLRGKKPAFFHRSGRKNKPDAKKTFPSIRFLILSFRILTLNPYYVAREDTPVFGSRSGDLFESKEAVVPLYCRTAIR
jgi:hypothetical protein